MKPLVQRALVLAALLATLAGCFASKPHWEVDVIGVVASETVTYVGTGTEVTFTLDDGRTYTLDNPNGISGQPRAGDLLIAGSKPSPWMMAAHLQHSPSWPEGCYEIAENGEEHPTTVDLDIGVTLQKAPDFQSIGRPFGETRIWGAALCLDRQGRVTRIYGGGGV